MQTLYWMSIMCIWIVVYNYWVHKGCFDVIKVSVNRVSTIYSLTHSAINWRDSHIIPNWTYWSAGKPKRQTIYSSPHPRNECELSVNGVWMIFVIASWKIQRAAGWYWAMIALPAAFRNITCCDNIASMFQQSASMERQQLLALHHRQCKGCAATLNHNLTIGCFSRQNVLRQCCFYVLKMSVNRVSMIFGFAS